MFFFIHTSHSPILFFLSSALVLAIIFCISAISIRYNTRNFFMRFLFCRLLKCPSLYPGARNKITPTKRWVFSANAIERYAFILVTTPAPPILPPSRIAKRNRSFIAIEATSFTLNVAVEQLPGLHGMVSNFKSVRHAADIALCPSHVARDQELKGVGQDDRALSRGLCHRTSLWLREDPHRQRTG